jgi:hypothetical protein
MKKLLLIFSALPLFVSAQNFHFSARVGMAGYQGDLKPKTVSFSQTSFLGSLGVRYDLTERITARSYFSLTSLRGDDKKGTATNQTRNLNFKTSLFEWEAGVQYNILDPNYSWWIPYVYAGFGIYHFNPYTKDENGAKTFLKPLATEGTDYKLTQFCIPFGIGVDRSLNEDMRVGFEMGYRKLFTDHIDDVSGYYVDQATLLAAKGQKSVDLAYRGDEVGAGPYPPAGTVRGNPKNKDGYFYIGFTYTLRFYFDKYKEIAGLPAYKRNKRAGCPSTRY